MSYVSAFAHGRSSPPVDFTANTASPTHPSQTLDIRELSAQIARCPARSRDTVHRLLVGGTEPDPTSNLYLATSRGDEATLRDLLQLFERCAYEGKLTQQQCHEFLRGDGCRQGSEVRRDCALAVAAAGSDGLHRPLMLQYLRAYLGDWIRAKDFESLMTGWLPASTAERTAALNSPGLTDCLRYYIHCVWKARDANWLGESGLERMLALVGHDMRDRPSPNALDQQTGALKHESGSTSGLVSAGIRTGNPR